MTQGHIELNQQRDKKKEQYMKKQTFYQYLFIAGIVVMMIIFKENFLNKRVCMIKKIIIKISMMLLFKGIIQVDSPKMQ